MEAEEGTPPADATLVAELTRMRIRALNSRAEELGVQSDKLDEAEDADASFEMAEDPGAWRIARARLEAQHSASIRKRKPRWLPFVQARKWSRAMWFTTEEDWREWIETGEKRNAYIPSRPDEVYASSWQGWEDFLNGPYLDEQ